MAKQEIELQPKELCERRDSIHFESRMDASEEATKDFTSKQRNFLKECHMKDVLLEGLLTTVLLGNSDLIDVFQTGISKATHFSELGDLPTILSVIKRLCASLHRKRKQKKQHIVTWCEQNGIKEGKVKSIDKQLRNSYKNLNLSSTVNHGEENQMTFHKDATYVHETITRAMVTTWHENLCVYQGHLDLGYFQISSKRSLLVDPKSCFRLTNSPPTFALCFPSNTRSANLIVKVDEELAAMILANHYSTSTLEVLRQCTCVPITVRNVGFELGSVAATTLSHQLRQICDDSVLVEYNPDAKDLLVFCPPSTHAKIQLTVEAELERLRIELETKELQFPYRHNKNSRLTLQIGKGFKCTGIAGLRWRSSGPCVNVAIDRCYDNSLPFERNDLSALYATENTCEDVNCEEEEVTSRLLLLTDDISAYNSCFYWKRPGSGDKVVFVDSAAVLDCSVLVSVMFRPIPSVNFESTDANGVTSHTIFVIRRLFALAGLKVDNGENSIAIRLEEEGDDFPVKVKVVFPNLSVAAIGVKCLENNRSFCIDNREQLSKDLKTDRVAIRSDLYPTIRKCLQETLDALVAAKKVESFKDVVATFPDAMPFNRAPRMYICIQKDEKYSLSELEEALAPVFRYNTVNVPAGSKLRWLRSKEGKQFLEFVMTLTGAYIHYPQFQKKLHIYGNLSNRPQAVAILKNDLDLDDPDVGSSKFKWYVIYFTKRNYLPDSVKIWSNEFKLTTDEMVKSGQMKRYVMCEDRPELWIESTFDTCVQYTHKLSSRLEIVQEEQSSLNSEVKRLEDVCSVCYDILDRSLENCCILSVCGHAYCDECLVQMVTQSAMDQRFPIACARQNCDRMLTVHELRFLCGEFYYCNIANLLRSTFEGFVRGNSASLQRCLRPECFGFGPVHEDVRKMECFLCRRTLCVECGRKFHGESACDAIYTVIEWIELDRANRKRCPSCRIPIQKTDGCNCVYCSWCKTYICWCCTKFFHKDSKKCHSHSYKCTAKSSN